MRSRWVKRYRKVLVVSWAVWFVAVVTSSLLPGQVITAMASAASDKPAHAIMYCGLAFFPGLILETRWSRVQSVIAMVCTGLLLEAAQIRIPGRGADWSDVAWNIFGAVLGWMLAEGILLTAHGSDTTTR